jgi:trehalose synthase
MNGWEPIDIEPQPLARFGALVGERELALIEATAAAARERFGRRTIWHLSSTSKGGGVAEMLWALLPYARGAGIDTRWAVIPGSEEFFALTKRLHNLLHGAGEGAVLGDADRELYEEGLEAALAGISPSVGPGDVLFLHDPQTVGLAPAAKKAGAGVIWRCHIGVDRADAVAREAQAFLTPYARAADACVFSREAYVWPTLERDRVRIMPPSIDPFSAKNQELDEMGVAAIVGAIGLGPTAAGKPVFKRSDGSRGQVERRAEIHQDEPLPVDARVVVQVSRWDRLKDHRGLLDCFVRHLAGADAHLLLVGPAFGAVADDPEGKEVWVEILERRRLLPDASRRRTHLAMLPMDDLEENGAMVNALQRRADVVVQKSIAEGFGLTVAEAMWKARPVVGTRVGGIQDQIEDGVSGLLIDDPADLEAFGAAISSLLADPAEAARIGKAAKARILERYLGPERLIEYAELVGSVVDGTIR